MAKTATKAKPKVKTWSVKIEENKTAAGPAIENASIPGWGWEAQAQIAGLKRAAREAVRAFGRDTDVVVVEMKGGETLDSPMALTVKKTQMPGAKYRSLKRPKVYEALRAKGKSKRSAARISNAQARKKKRRGKRGY